MPRETREELTMGGFLRKRRGSKKPDPEAAGDPQVWSYKADFQGSVSPGYMIQEAVGISTRECGQCGLIFPSMNQNVDMPVQKASKDTWQREFMLDVGGYCPNCQMYRCPDHASFIETPAIGPYPGAAFWLTVGCSACGSRLTAGPQPADE
jgi:hypothetical protein